MYYHIRMTEKLLSEDLYLEFLSSFTLVFK